MKRKGLRHLLRLIPAAKAAPLALFFCVLWAPQAFASDPRSGLPTVGLIAGQNAPSLLQFVRYTSAARAMPADQLLEKLEESSLLQVTESTIDFGPPDTPLLVLVKVRNKSVDPGTWVFTTDRGSLRHIELFELIGQEVTVRLAADDLTTQKRMLNQYHAFAFEFSLQPGEERTLGVVFEAESSTKLPLSIMEPQEYQSLIEFQFNVVAAATVATLTLILLNAILFTVTGRVAFLHFVIAELALIYQAVHLSGYTTIFWFSEHAELARAISGIAKVVFALFSVRFVRSFLRTKETWPSIERPAQCFEAICWFSIFCLVAYPLIPFLTLRAASDLSVVIVFLALLGLPAIAVAAVIRHGWIYAPLVLGWSVWSLYLIYTILAVYTPLPEFPFQWRWMAPIGFFEALMLSIALGLDIRNIQKSEIRAQLELSEALQNRLELMRTAAVANSNRTLLEQQLRDTSNLVRSGGHDSRGFTGALKMYGHVIENSNDVDKTRKYGALVSELAEQLDTALNTIVDGTSGDSMLLDSMVRLETIDLGALLDTIKLIYEQTANQTGIKIRCRASASEIIGDRHLLIRLMSNLVSNALKYSQGGSILLGARVVGNTIRLEVWDQGPGFTPEQLQRLLSPQRIRERLNPDVDGSGSGLGICLELCDKMHGTLSARSSVGQGSLFRAEFSRHHPGVELKHRDIAILDDPAHWPGELVDALYDHGVTIRFVTSFDDLKIANARLIILDPALHASPPKEDPRCEIAICSYEPATVNLGHWASASSIAIAKPVTTACLLHLLMLLSDSDMST